MAKFDQVTLDDSLPGSLPLGGDLPGAIPLKRTPDEAVSSVMKALQAPAPVQPRGYMNVPGAAESKFLDPEGREISPREHFALNNRPTEERSLIGEAGAAVARTVLDLSESYVDTAMGLMGAPQKDVSERVFPYGPQPSMDGFVGDWLINGPIGFAGMVSQGPAGFGAMTYSDINERMGDDPKRALVALAGGTVGVGLGLVPVTAIADKIPGIKETIKRVGLGKFTEQVTKFTVENLINGAQNVAQDSTVEYLSRLAGAKPRDLDLIGSFAAGVLGGAALGSIKLAKDIHQTKAFNHTREQALKHKLISDSEAQLISNRPGVLTEVILRRIGGDEVEIKQQFDKDGKGMVDADGDPVLDIKATPDIVPWSVKRDKNFDPLLIEAERQALKESGKGFFTDTSRLPPKPDEIVPVVTDLLKLRTEIEAQLKPDDLTPKGLPVTERALVLRDIKLLQERMGTPDNPPSRMDLERAKSLLEYGQKKKDSVDRISEVASLRTATSPEIASPISLRPINVVFAPLKSAQEAGYLRRSSELTQRPRVQRMITKLQRRLIEELQVLRKRVDMTPEEKFMITKVREADYIDKVTTLLGADNDNPKGAKRRVAQVVKKSKLSAQEQVEVMSALDKAIDTIADKTVNETQLGTVELLLEAAVDPNSKLDEKSIAVLELVHKMMKDGTEFMPWGERVRKGHAELKSLMQNIAGYGLEKGRSELVNLTNSLPPDIARPFLESALNAKTGDELKLLGQKVIEAQEAYIRTSTIEDIKNLTGEGLALNPQRDSVLEMLKKLNPEIKAEGVEYITKPAVRFKNRIVEAENKNGLEEQHADILARMMKENPKDTPALVDASNLEYDETHGFMTSTGRYVDRVEANEIRQKALVVETKEDGTEEVKNTSPEGKQVIVTDSSTGKIRVSKKGLEANLAEQPIDVVLNLRNQIRRELRAGQIQRGLYREYLKYTTTNDAIEANRILAAFSPRSKARSEYDRLFHMAGMVVDPKMYEAWFSEISKGKKDSPIYKIFHGDFVPGMGNHALNIANTRKFVGELSKKYFKIDSESMLGSLKLGKHMAEEIAPGITRDRAMAMYALSTDVGRKADLEQYGAEAMGTTLDVKAGIEALSKEEKAFVDEMKGYYQKNPFIEKSFSNFELLNGYRPDRVVGYYPSARTPEATRVEPDFGTFMVSLIKDVDPLKERAEGVESPFNLDRGFLSTFYRTTSKLSLFGEVGKELYRAQSLVLNRSFEDSFRRKFGDSAFDSLKLYLANIHGQVGHTPTALDQTINHFITAYSVSRTALNIFSAAKQFGHVFTLFADGTLDSAALRKSLLEGSMFSKTIGKTMVDNSGLAYQRYHGGFLQDMLHLVDENRQPSKLQTAQHMSMVLQREIDRMTMKMAWRASELTAQKLGLKGEALTKETARLFEIAAGRDQPTANPLYATELEVLAKRQPLLRGTMMFMREQNRIYNVVRRHVVQFGQDPTPGNFGHATRAVMYGVVANALFIAGVNQLRRWAYGQPTDEEKLAKDALGNVIGMYYMLSPVDTMIRGFNDPMYRQMKNDLGPILGIVSDLRSGVWSLSDAMKASGEDIKSGPRRGESKEAQAYTKAFDSFLSAANGALGLPLWSIWTQAKGLYNWTDGQSRLMLQLEKEYQTLKSENQGSSLRFRQLQATKDKVNEIHRKREKGLISDPAARQAIEAELSKVVR